MCHARERENSKETSFDCFFVVKLIKMLTQDTSEHGSDQNSRIVPWPAPWPRPLAWHCLAVLAPVGLHTHWRINATVTLRPRSELATSKGLKQYLPRKHTDPTR